jgi:NAD(P)-dependent dehydrogenase (short-subunit alcohol dehydrogenase family)
VALDQRERTSRADLPRGDAVSGVLDGKVAIVTGSSRGIGAAIARRFAAEGAKVALVARTVAPGGKLAGSLEETAALIRKAGGTCCLIAADLADAESRATIVPATLDAFGAVDILVNNAAWSRFIPIWEVNAKQMTLAFQMNVHAPHELAQQALPHMKARGAGWILNISSATADLPPTAPWDETHRAVQFNMHGHPTLYAATKAALDRLTAGWGIELAKSGIAVNSMAPVGAVASEGALAVGGWDERDHIEPVEAMAEAALQLCYRPAESLSGEVVRSLPLLKRLGVDVRGLDGGVI